MPRKEARMYSRIWDSDDDFIARTVAAQRMYWLLCTQPGLSLCGVIDYTTKRWARLAVDTTNRNIEAAIHELADHRFVIVDLDTEELWLRGYLKNDPGVFRTPNILIGMAQAWTAVSSLKIRAGLNEQIREGLAKGLPQGFTQQFAERLPEPFAKQFGQQLPQGLPEQSYTRARAGVLLTSSSSSDYHYPTVVPTVAAATDATTSNGRPHPDPPPNGGLVESEIKEPNLDTPAEVGDHLSCHALAMRYVNGMTPCGKPTRARRIVDAHRTVGHLLTHLDANFLDEIIGRLILSSDPPYTVGLLLTAAQSEAAKHQITVPPLPGPEAADPVHSVPNTPPHAGDDE